MVIILIVDFTVPLEGTVQTPVDPRSVPRWKRWSSRIPEIPIVRTV